MQGEKIYEYVVDITGVTDFGVTFEAIQSGQAPIPPQGARFDFTYDGRSTGRIAGRVTGTDHFYLRPDGRGELNLRGVMETDDGQRIAVFAEGVSQTNADGTTGLFETVKLSTAAPDYAWVNTRYILAEGGMKDGKIHIAAYMA